MNQRPTLPFGLRRRTDGRSAQAAAVVPRVAPSVHASCLRDPRRRPERRSGSARPRRLLLVVRRAPRRLPGSWRQQGTEPRHPRSRARGRARDRRRLHRRRLDRNGMGPDRGQARRHRHRTGSPGRRPVRSAVVEGRPGTARLHGGGTRRRDVPEQHGVAPIVRSRLRRFRRALWSRRSGRGQRVLLPLASEPGTRSDTSRPSSCGITTGGIPTSSGACMSRMRAGRILLRQASQAR